jgi:photosystem II stability/assembly factor-like uncharacterized protein
LVKAIEGIILLLTVCGFGLAQDSLVPRASDGNWYSVASSADGTKLIAGRENGFLYTSTDSGVTWTARESTRDWLAVDSSADGVKLVAVAYAGQIYTSVDSGLTRTPQRQTETGALLYHRQTG